MWIFQPQQAQGEWHSQQPLGREFVSDSLLSLGYGGERDSKSHRCLPFLAFCYRIALFYFSPKLSSVFLLHI